jgi:hypothetical protein
VAYPQIDGGGPAASAWNARQARTLPARGADDGSDVDADYTIGCANRDLLSLVAWESEYGHGAAHGMYSNATATTLFAPEPRAMMPADLFAAGADWPGKLPTLFWQAFLQGQDAYKRSEDVERVIREVATDDGRWLLTSEGLQIDFSAYEGGSYATTPGPITVPWAALKPLLPRKGPPSCQVSFVGKG